MTTTRRRTDPTKVTFTPRGYERAVGYVQSKSGKRRARRFRLGSDKLEAINRAAKISKFWYQNIKDGGDVWIDRYLAYATKIANGSFDENNFAVVKTEDQVNSMIAWDEPIIDEGGGATLHLALDAYIESVESGAGRVGATKNIVGCIRRIRDAADDQPINGMGFDKIRQIAAYWLSLPPSNSRHSKGKDPISPETAGNHCKQLRRFCRWLDQTDLPELAAWRLPRNFDECVKVNKTVLEREYKARTGKSKSREAVRIFSDEELASIWQAANRKTRLCISLALNIGATQGDISAIRKDELVNWNSKISFIDRDRTKTGEAGKFLVWSITKELINEFKNGGDKLFNLPTNTISGSWYRLRDKINLPDPSPFKSLRKTGAQAILSVSDEATASAYLAHNSASTDKILEGVYINRDYRRLTEALGVVGQRWAKILKY